MGSLYVANCTPQVQLVYYRTDFNRGGSLDLRGAARNPKFHKVSPGRQEPIGGDLHPTQIGEIVEHYAKNYGMLSQEEVLTGKGNHSQLIAYVYNIGQPVSAKAIIAANKHNIRVKSALGKIRRERAAAGANDTVIRHIENDNSILNGPKSFNIEFEQLDQSEAGESRIEEGYRIDRTAPQGGPPRAPRAPRRAKAA